MGLADRLDRARLAWAVSRTSRQGHGPTADIHPALTSLLQELPDDFQLALEAQMHLVQCVECNARCTLAPPESWAWARDHARRTGHDEHVVHTCYLVRAPEGQDR